MPSYQKLALKYNSRGRYKGSKFDSIPYKPFKICSGSFSLEPAQNQRDLYGAVSNFHPLYFGWELQLRGNFWQGPFSKDALLENGTKSHNFTNLFFVTSHFKDSVFSVRDSCSFRLIFAEVAEGFPILVFSPNKSRALERFYVHLTP